MSASSRDHITAGWDRRYADPMADFADVERLVAMLPDIS